jgi:23S rRNA (uridine2552-2'-O)-methyltransferase
MGRSKSSHRWLQEHERDHYVQKSRTEGYRSRASYKLVELDKKDKLLRPGMTVVDLGSAPGGWSQVVADKVGSSGRVIASDILPMDTIADVAFIQGDFTDDAVFEEIMAAMNAAQADLVISDMAPNMSGIRAVDQPAAMYLVELALDLAARVLKPGGNFVAKIFQGEGFDELLKEARERFDRVVIRKPDASRSRSREIYLVAKGLK